MERKLAAILVADFVGSTAQMAADEEAAIARISSAIDLTQHCIHRNGGRVFNTAGDSVLAEFPSPVGSLRAALETRAQLGGSQEHSVQDMRFGLHVADVVADGADLKGDGVNMAARLQSVAEPGQILVSDMLCSHVRRVSPCRLRSLGEVVLKGFDAPVPVWSADTSADRHVFQVASTNPAPGLKSGQTRWRFCRFAWPGPKTKTSGSWRSGSAKISSMNLASSGRSLSAHVPHRKRSRGRIRLPSDSSWGCDLSCRGPCASWGTWSG